MEIKTRARVYDIIGINVFHAGKIMRFHLIKKIIPYLLYYLRQSLFSFVFAGPRHDLVHTALNRFILSIFSHTTLSITTACDCALCRNNLISFSILSAVLWKIAVDFPQML